MDRIEEFRSPAMNVYLDGLAPASKLAYTNKMEVFLDFCNNGDNDGPYEATLEDVSEYIISLHDAGYKTSTLWTTLSMLLTFFEIGKDANVNAIKKTYVSTFETMGERGCNEKSKGVMCYNYSSIALNLYNFLTGFHKREYDCISQKCTK